MGLHIQKINNVYEDRYTMTINLIEEVHRLIEDGSYKEILASGEKLAVYILNKVLGK